MHAFHNNISKQQNRVWKREVHLAKGPITRASHTSGLIDDGIWA
jgi:hypothetical protein